MKSLTPIRHGLRTIVCASIVFGFWTSAHATVPIDILHTFSGDADGGRPIAGLTVVGPKIYGTAGGSVPIVGTVFSMNHDGSDYNVLHSFNTSSINDGQFPYGTLTSVGITLYGTTSAGGSAGGFGTVFSMNLDGSNYRVRHSFNQADGRDPQAALTLVGSTLYGTTVDGGSTFGGTVFKMSLDGSGFQSIHTFASGTDGGGPRAAITPVGSTLYGTASAGGAHGDGTVYSMNLDGSNFQVLHSFAGGVNDGQEPYGALLNIGSTLYGTTRLGGFYAAGTVFSMNLDGSNFKLLHTINPSVGDGSRPHAGLIIAESTLYGTTAGNDNQGGGTVFAMSLDGAKFQTLYTFSGGIDGKNPFAALAIHDSTLFGTTYAGGTGHGTVYSLPVPEPSAYLLAGLGFVGLVTVRLWNGTTPPRLVWCALAKK